MQGKAIREGSKEGGIHYYVNPFNNSVYSSLRGLGGRGGNKNL